MRGILCGVGILVVVTGSLQAQGQAVEAPQMLVREMVYNEMHDHETHGYWRYWVERRGPKETQLVEQVETVEGSMTRLMMENGQPLSVEAQHKEQERIDHLLHSPDEQAKHRQGYAEDEKRVALILSLLPDAYIYEFAGDENGCHKLTYHPNPDYQAHTMEARIFHSMSGTLWVSAKYKHLVRVEGVMGENVDIGFGILGRLYKGGWYCLERRQVGTKDWKTERLEVHMNGRAMLFRTIAHETSEVRRGFTTVPAGIHLAEATAFMTQTETPDTDTVASR